MKKNQKIPEALKGFHQRPQITRPILIAAERPDDNELDAIVNDMQKCPIIKRTRMGNSQRIVPHSKWLMPSFTQRDTCSRVRIVYNNNNISNALFKSSPCNDKRE